MRSPRATRWNSTFPILLDEDGTPKRSSLTRREGMPRSTGFRPASLALVDGAGPPVVVIGSKRQRRECGFPRSVKLAVRKRAGNGSAEDACCEACGYRLGRDAGECQHIVARGMGGCKDPLINSAANCALLCWECHRVAESRDREMGARGFWLPQGTDPRMVPMMLASPYGSGVLVYRSVDGGYLFEPPDGGEVA